ncbi:MAG: hypothetical protein JSV99_11960 [Planctomycetota bacterium]|nr:MAG: hypothetical protein JSV99_11960 [Planctomycetota bacterium]
MATKPQFNANPADCFMQNKPNFPAAQMNVTSFYTMDYENNSNWTLGQNKPNQSQFKANTNPIFPDAQMNATSSLTKPYEIAPLRERDKNKPNQTQSNPVSNAGPTPREGIDVQQTYDAKSGQVVAK